MRINVGLVDVDSKIPNLQLMKISAWHKERGDDVRFYNPLFDKPDRIYISKIFDFTKDYEYTPSENECHIFKGGSGYDINYGLDLDYIYPDYSLYNCDYAMGFVTRGCIRNCPFCIVPQKEGGIKQVGNINNFWNGQTHIKLLDNNLTAHDDAFFSTMEDLTCKKIKTDFSQGLDIRLIDDEKAKALSKVKLWKQIHFAFDHINQEKAVRKGIETLKRHLSLSRVMFYVLIGYDSTQEEDLYRVRLLHSLGVDPFVMPYDKSDRYQKDFARWVNHKAIFKSVTWEDYKKTG